MASNTGHFYIDKSHVTNDVSLVSQVEHIVCYHLACERICSRFIIAAAILTLKRAPSDFSSCKISPVNSKVPQCV